MTILAIIDLFAYDTEITSRINFGALWLAILLFVKWEKNPTYAYYLTRLEIGLPDWILELFRRIATCDKWSRIAMILLDDVQFYDYVTY